MIRSVSSRQGRPSRVAAQLVAALDRGDTAGAGWALQSCPRLQVRAARGAEIAEGWRVTITLDGCPLRGLDLSVDFTAPRASWKRLVVEALRDHRARAALPPV